MEAGHDLPIGISRRRRMGVDHVGMNCAACHSGTVRDTPTAVPRVVLGMPAHKLDLQDFVQFVLECSLDSRLTPEAVRAQFPATGERPSLFERALLRFGFIDRLKLTTLDLRNRIAPILDDRLPRWGQGRVDTFNPYKAIQFNWDIAALPDAELIAATDFPSLWNQAPREGLQLHWDGNNDSVDERNLSAGLGAGITPVTVDHAGLKRVRDWTWTLKPPPYPYDIDRTVADRGAAVYRETCAVVSRRPPLSRRPAVRRPAGTGGGHRSDRHRSPPAGLLHRGLRGQPVRPLSRIRLIGSPAFARPAATRTIRSTASGCAAPTCTTARCRRCARCWTSRLAGPVASIAGTTSSIGTGVGFVSTVAEADGRRSSASTPRSGQRQRRPRYGTTLPDADKAAIVEY